MRSVKKETIDEMARVVRKYWATGDTDILALNHRIGRELSEQAFGSDKKWLQFCDILDGVICLNRNVSNDIIYKIFGLLCIEVSAPAEAGADALTTPMEEGEKSVMSTDYLNPHRIYPDDVSRRIDKPPGFDSIRQGSEEKGGHMSKVYDFNGIGLWFADGYPSTREEAEGYFKHAQTKKLDLTEVIVVRDGDWADIKYTVRARPFERIRRITGYLVGTTDRWNNAKQAEEHDRVKHTIER